MSVDPRYPIGRFAPPKPRSRMPYNMSGSHLLPFCPDSFRKLRATCLRTICRPDIAREAGLCAKIIHHIADSHINSYCRYRLALTEDNPMIRPYNETAWAELPDAKHAPVEISLQLIAALHTRWITLLKSMDDAAFQRTLHHPDQGSRTLNQMTGLYAWHGLHHLAHIRLARGLALSV